ncbi:DNA-binding protein H-NS [Paraburkholderia bannensis]|jgi:DNA-binding protein H-NS|uniref:DNA-binding protein H-NS n=1 Tax=Paraburkholderia bannensis TaxID=765414 RepID=A0A7W9WUZ3_9BURK|nr:MULTISPECIES: H-NS histone family protein [Paraburkholderia]MBB3259943.1 DNA-binding protein H-NS [Paraburkholderia sp. WP4_3_2]MBB6105149.1 DNA-binding protein H-NS [Paraburkholderia bannensis]
MVTLDAINLKIAKLQKQAETLANKQTSVGLTKIRDLMHKHGLSVADIESFVGKKRGRKPGVAAANGAAKAPRAAVHHVAPKYADPKTGATWTGRGRAPLWIRDVKDRSKFLIEGAPTAAAPKAKTTGAKRGPKPGFKRAAAKAAAATKTGAKRGRKAAATASAPAPAKKTRAPRKPRAVAVEAAAAPAAAA